MIRAVEAWFHVSECGILLLELCDYLLQLGELGKSQWKTLFCRFQLPIDVAELSEVYAKDALCDRHVESTPKCFR